MHSRHRLSCHIKPYHANLVTDKLKKKNKKKKKKHTFYITGDPDDDQMKDQKESRGPDRPHPFSFIS
jgi:hypothetical protein